MLSCSQGVVGGTRFWMSVRTDKSQNIVGQNYYCSLTRSIIQTCISLQDLQRPQHALVSTSRVWYMFAINEETMC